MTAGLLAYDATLGVVATLDHMVARNDEGQPVGLIDFEAHEAAGGKLRDVWEVSNATGSGTWPEWLGGQAHQFTVELGPDGRIAALVHRTSGFRRERAAIEAAIAAVPLVNGVRDIRALVGGPQRPLPLDAEGRTSTVKPTGTPAHLPLIGAR